MEWCFDIFLTLVPKQSRTAVCILGSTKLMWGFPIIRGTIMGVLIIRTVVFGGLYWGPPI